MSIKLTDTQLVLLGAAAQRKDLCLVAPPTLKGASPPPLGDAWLAYRCQVALDFWFAVRRLRGSPPLAF
jgi:hypothetical protein